MKYKIITLSLILVSLVACDAKKVLLPEINIQDKKLSADIYELRRRIVPILDGFGIITLKNKSISKQKGYDVLKILVDNIQKENYALDQLTNKNIIRLFGNPYLRYKEERGFYIYQYRFNFGADCPSSKEQLPPGKRPNWSWTSSALRTKFQLPLSKLFLCIEKENGLKPFIVFCRIIHAVNGMVTDYDFVFNGVTKFIWQKTKKNGWNLDIDVIDF